MEATQWGSGRGGSDTSPALSPLYSGWRVWVMCGGSLGKVGTRGFIYLPSTSFFFFF